MSNDTVEGSRERVLIVGAGPSGLALALSLATSGRAVRLIDKAPQPATTSRAIGIQARTLEMLEPFGLAQAFVEIGRMAPAGNIYGSSQRIVRTDFASLDSNHPYILFLEQSETERLLTEALEKLGVHVERGVDLDSFEQSQTSVSVSLRRDGGGIDRDDFAYVAGCDGAHSRVRHGLDLHFAGRKLSQGFMLADLHIESELAKDEYHVFASADGLVAVFPLPVGHRLIVEMDASSVARSGNPRLEDLRSIVAHRIDVPLRLSGLRWSSCFEINSRIVSSLRRGRVFLVGDAAHIHSPAGAQGMNTGIQDAFNLGWKLAFVLRGDADPSLLRTYETERHPVERDVLRRTERLQQIVTLKSPVLRFLRDRILPRIGMLLSAEHSGAVTMSQIGIGYRTQASSKGAAASNGLRPGDRVPDAWIVDDTQSERRRLHANLDPTRLTLLVIRQGSLPETPRIDPASTLARDERVTIWVGTEVPGDGLRGERFAAGKDHFYLVRPDGYLAVHGPLSRLEDAVVYLNQLKQDDHTVRQAA